MKGIYSLATLTAKLIFGKSSTSIAHFFLPKTVIQRNNNKNYTLYYFIFRAQWIIEAANSFVSKSRF